MININESIEDDVYYFTLNFDKEISAGQKQVLEAFWSENKKFFDEKLVENNYALYRMTNLINPNAMHNIRRLLRSLKDSLIKIDSKEIVNEYSFEYNKAQDRYLLKTYSLICPTGYTENGNVCTPVQETNVQQFRICPIGTKWDDKLQVCLPEKKMPHTPEDYYWDFDSSSCLPLKTFKTAKLRDVLKFEELSNYRQSNYWEFSEVSDLHLILNANVPKSIYESLLYNFFQHKWREFKVKIYIEIGKSLRDNYFNAINSVYEEDGVLNIIIKERNETSIELISEVKKQVSYYWEKFLDEIEKSENLTTVMSKKENKVYLKLEDGSLIFVSPDVVDLLK